MKVSEKLSGSRGRIAGVATHLLFITIIFILPELLMAIAMPHRNGFTFYPGFYVKNLVYITVFYLDYFVLIDRTLGRATDRRAIARFVLWNLLVILCALALCWVLSNVVFPAPRRHGHLPAGSRRALLKAASFLIRDGAMLILTVALAVALRLSAKWNDLRHRHQELLASQRATELDSLKSQLNPHFLFNTLNTIYALIAVDGADAQRAVHRLSGLLRYMLYEDVAAVPLRREADFIEDYVSLMKLRLSGRDVVLTVDLADKATSNVPPLLFVPLVENAFKYGTAGADHTPVEISLVVEGDAVVCTTRNAYTPGEGGREGSSGIGLANLRRRLTLLFGQKASFGTVADGHLYTARLVVPLT